MLSMDSPWSNVVYTPLRNRVGVTRLSNLLFVSPIGPSTVNRSQSQLPFAERIRNFGSQSSWSAPISNFQIVLYWFQCEISLIKYLHLRTMFFIIFLWPRELVLALITTRTFTWKSGYQCTCYFFSWKGSFALKLNNVCKWQWICHCALPVFVFDW
jgi:hypothetical protein